MNPSEEAKSRGIIGYNAGGGAIYSPTKTPSNVVNVAQNPNVAVPVRQDSTSQNSGILGYGSGGGAIYDVNKTPKNVLSPNTVASNQTVIDKIPKDIAQLDGLGKKGSYSTGDSVYYPDGTLQTQNQNTSQTTGYQQPVTTEFTEEDYVNSPEYKIFEQMRSSLDSSTSQQIAGIQQQLQARREETNEINRVQAKSMENALLMGGATGKGGSARYAPVSSQGILNAQENYRMKQIRDIDMQEQQLIAAAREAQRTGDFQIMGKQVELINQLRAKKTKETMKLNETIAEQNNKLREQNQKAQKDTAIANLYAGGYTDVNSIMEVLGQSGAKDLGLTSKDVKETLDNLVPPGLDDLVKTLRDKGAPQETIQKVLSSKNINEAYNNAGAWSAGGTGNVGEYNLYKAQAIDAGLQPVGYQEWVTKNEEDKLKRQQSLRQTATSGQLTKKKGTAGTGSVSTSSVYASDIDALVGSVRSSLLTEPAREGFDDAIKRARNDSDRLSIIAATAKVPSAVRTDIANTGVGQRNVKQAIKLIEDGVKTGLLTAGTQYAANVVGRSVDPKLTQLQTYLTAAVQPYRNAVTGAAWGSQEESEYARLFGSAKDTPENLLNKLRTLDKIMTDKRVGLLEAQIDPLQQYSAFEQSYATPSTTINTTSQSLIQDEKTAESDVINYGATNKQVQGSIRQMVADGVPYITIKQVLGIQ